MMHHHKSRQIATPADEPRASFVLLSLVVLFFAAVFFVNDADWQVSTYENYSLSADDAESQVADGSRWRQLSYITIGAIGILLSIAPSRQRVDILSLPFALLAAYVLVCLASCVWSDAAWLTTKRLATSIFGLLAIIGVARHLSTRDIIDVALGIGTILLAIGIFAELRAGTFTPWASEYRFAGIVHPNAQASICGVMAIAAFFGMKAAGRRKLIYFGFLVLAAGFLVLTKSRTSIAASLCGVAAAWYIGASRDKKTLISLSLPAAVCAGLLALLLLGVELSSSATAATSFGRDTGQDLMSFNGRVPLWANLMQHVAERPLLGYGYQAFWTPDRIYEVSLEQEWTVPNAHSVYLDILLGTGLVGGAILALAVFVTLRRIIRRCLETTAPEDCFVLAAFVYAFIAAIFESGFAQPNGFESFIIGAALLHAVSHSAQTDAVPEAISRDADSSSNWNPASVGGIA